MVIQHWLEGWDRIAPVYAIAMPVIGLRLLLGHWSRWMAAQYLWVPVWTWPESTLLLALAVHAVFSFLALRRVLAAGYTREDIIAALQPKRRSVMQEERLEPLPPFPARLIRDGTYIAVGSIVFLTILPFLIDQIEDSFRAYYIWEIAGGMIVTARLAAYIGLGIGLVYPGRYPRPDNWWQRLQEWFWRSPLGAGAARMARIGLHPRLAEQTIHRPTEMALSLAADQLFGALPAALQAVLGDVPGLVKTLERQATALRASIEELEAAGIGTDSGDDADRQALVDLRRSMERRHGEVIGALERIRLQLIRLAAGANQSPELTEVLLAARKLETDLGRSVAGQESVRRLLHQRQLSGATPSPSPV
jgi:serine/threonine-protein kinase